MSSKTIKIDRGEIAELLERVKIRALTEGDYDLIEDLAELVLCLNDLLADKNASIERLRKMLFGASTETTRAVLGEDEEKPEEPPGDETASEEGETKKRKNHGRKSASDYPGANRVQVKLEDLKPGCNCPNCDKGKVYKIDPENVPQFSARAIIDVTIYEIEKVRCNLCGEIFKARCNLCGETVGSMIGVLRYGGGMPFYRLEKLQESFGMPLPASNQWEIVKGVADRIAPAFSELERQAAAGQVIHNDDTKAIILALEKERKEEGEPKSPSESDRTGTFTSGIVSRTEVHDIALYYTGWRHAGENLSQVLKNRPLELGPPIQMCDALSRNLPKEFAVILSKCNAHSRRRFVDVASNFPVECRFVLETLRDVYHNDAIAKEKNLSPEARLQFHREFSGPLMAKLKTWLEEQLEGKKVEPNCGLGKAISYMLKHWEGLTQFLKVANAPLDNNLCERILKKAILHRRNSLFYKTELGAWVGDLFMSLIQTCILSGANPFDYLTALQRHADKLYADPGRWMPWNYRESLAKLGILQNDSS